MDSFLWIIVFIVMITIVIVYLYAPDRAYLNNRPYGIYKKYENNGEALKLMDTVNTKVVKVLAHMKKKYIDGQGSQGAKNSSANYIVERMIKKYNSEVLVENDPKLSSDTSYTINKGDQIYVCLRNRLNPDELVDENTLTFVLLHELSHIGSESWGHNDEFWRVFKFVLKNAVECFQYQYVNYAVSPITYCGLNITYQPLDDGALRDF